MSSFSIARDAYLDIREWLFAHAFPMWWDVGGDRVLGGFAEKLSPAGEPLRAPRRTRVVGRQIFSYAVAARTGWPGDGQAAVSHGLDYLLRHCIAEDGTVHSMTEPDGRVVRGDFDLYDHAFALFGLAAAAGVQPHRRRELEAVAQRMMDAMLAGWSHPGAGFEESVPRTLPLKANPHMHVFEACLAWIDLGGHSDRSVWDRVADDIAQLCLDRYIHPGSGAIREFYDADWRAMDGDQGRIIEPGHQFEWAWLLKRWGLRRRRKDALAAARRLTDIGETFGTNDAHGLTINELWDDLSVKDGDSRLWQQTERIKAWVAMAAIAESDAAREAAFRTVADSVRGLQRYLAAPCPGLWWDRIRADGSPVEQDCPASSLYHIVCAFDVLDEVFRRDDEVRPAVFLDRDGVINVDHGYIGDIDRLTFVDGAADAIRFLNHGGYRVFVVTNQAGIGHGYYDVDDYYILRDFIHRTLGEQGARVHDERFCPYHPDARLEAYRSDHDCRKPRPGMLVDLLNVWAVDVGVSFLIGDKPTDIAAAESIGMPGYLFAGGNLLDFVKAHLPPARATAAAPETT